MKRTAKRIITISSVLVVILALLCTGVSLYINSIFDRIEKIPEVSRVDPSNEFFETDSPEESPTTAPVVKPEDIGWGEIEPFLDDKLINILLVGQDRYVGTARQRNVMEALYKKFQYADTDTLMKLFQEVLPYLSTNMTNGQIMRLAAKCIPAFGSIELHSYCVPANDSFYYASIREMSVLVPDLDKIRGQLENEYLPLN